MGLFGRLRLGLLISLLPIGLILMACSNASVASDSEYAVASADELETATDSAEVDAISDAEALGQLSINVSLTDEGYEASSIFVPVGRNVKLIVRNRGTSEHHYRVVGLMPRDLLWINRPEDVREEGVSDEDHEAHHSSDFTAYRAESRAGIKPFGDEVHAYVDRGGVDMVLFVPTKTGTFEVECPLHPEVTGKVTVF